MHGGAKVLMLEAGRKYVPETETPMFQTPDRRRCAAAHTPDKSVWILRFDGGWRLDVPGEPYVRTTEEPAGRFDWWRARMLGGRTNHGAASRCATVPTISSRRAGMAWASTGRSRTMSRALLRQGGDAHRHLRRTDGLENTPNSRIRLPIAAAGASGQRLLIRNAPRASAFPSIPVHRAVLTQQLDFRRSPALLHPGNLKAQKIIAEDMQRRAACFWATPCGRGCSIRANYQSTTVHLPPALATGNLDIVTDAMVREVRWARRPRTTA